MIQGLLTRGGRALCSRNGPPGARRAEFLAGLDELVTKDAKSIGRHV